MKLMRINSFMLLLALSGLMVFASCNNDDDEPAPEPNMNLTASGSSTDANVGDTIDFRIDVTHQLDLEKFTISSSPVNTDADTTVSGIGESGFSYNFEYVVPSGLGAGTSIKFSFKATDGDGESTSKSYTVNVKESGEELNQYTAVMMGAQNNPDFGSFYSTSKNTTYLTGEVNGDNSGNRVNVDFIYYHGDSKDQTIAAPSDPTVEEFSAYKVDEWSSDERNNTKYTGFNGNFSEVNRTTYFKNGNGSDLRSTLQNNNKTKFNDFQSGDAFAFLTEDDRIGICKIASIDRNGTTDGSSTARADDEITINVKVEPN